ncbi:hypothetical protein QTL95_06830 [Rhizobium sp. S152]|uniref:hypothetical protein n=1 Tax=Rhizobium sp. S152 TaxID=3055038 RepID=UPI0025A9A00D|nr:hypothetical protein [Rhizobium sp. S152]MDM9625601.1 hypothetical protein [Rhizobium sp. S152]
MVSNDGESRGPLPDRDTVREQLDRILRSGEFHAPDRGRQFLRYVVEEALQGRADALNAHAIARAVFARGAAFDAQSDPVVRIEAGRIRRALERYYLVCGGNDPVIITIPKGHYAPSFERRAPAGVAAPGAVAAGGRQSAQGGDRPLRYRDLLVPVGVPAVFGAIAILALIRPLEYYLGASPTSTQTPSATVERTTETRIAVEPLSVLGARPGGAEMARGLNDQLISRLAKLDGIVVLAPVASVSARPVGVVFNLQGNIAFEEESVHVQVRLVKSADGTVVWAKRFDQDAAGGKMLDAQDRLCTAISREISDVLKKGG